MLDRRLTPRLRSLEEHEIAKVRIRPGREASMIDLSSWGAHVETAHRLMPGAHVEVRLLRHERWSAIKGRVLRCDVATVAPAHVTYRAAINFDVALPWLAHRGD